MSKTYYDERNVKESEFSDQNSPVCNYRTLLYVHVGLQVRML